MVSIGTVKSVKIFQVRGVLKTLFLKILTKEYIRLDILPWMTELHPEFDLRLFLRSSLHTTLATDICEKSLSLWFASFRPPPHKRGEGLKKHTPNLKNSNIFNRPYSIHILGFEVWAFLTIEWLTRKNSVGGFFWNQLLHFALNLCLNFFKSPQQIFLVWLNFSSGNPKLHNLVYGFNMDGQKC